MTAIRFEALAATLCALALCAAPVAAGAQQPPRIESLKQRDQQLDALRGEQRKTAESEATLKREIEQLGADRRKLNQDLIDTAGRIRELETRIAATEARLGPLDEKDAAIKQSLDGRRAVIAEVLAALQRMGRRPPPALLVSPDEALQSVRAAIALGAVVPEMRQEAQALVAELQALSKVRREIAAEQGKLRNEQESIANDRARMAILIEERQKQQTEREAALIAERVRAADLAQQADSLKDLIAALEKELDPATRAARESTRSDSRPAMAAFRDPGRLPPASTFASLRGQVRVPVNGVKIRDYGAPDGAGGVEKGLSITTRAGAQVTAPADGWVVYAGAFRSYGQLLILNAGGGYHVLLAGMERISVDLGQLVLTGEPVAVMGNASHIAAILATGSSQPVLYVEFRKDGIPIDPGPWWAATEVEKVRG